MKNRNCFAGYPLYSKNNLVLLENPDLKNNPILMKIFFFNRKPKQFNAAA